MLDVLGALALSRALPAAVDLRADYDKFGLTVCQQNGPSCWDYTVIGILEYERAATSGVAERLSTGFLAWAATATDAESDAGSNFGRAYRGLERYGIPPLNLGGEPDAAGNGPTPSKQALAAAARFGQIDIHWIRLWDRTTDLKEQQLAAIQSELADGHPVAIGMRWPNHEAFTSPISYLLKMPERGDVFDGHCVVFVGYRLDPSLPGGGAFHFRNSWGPQWADQGYAWMPFELARQCVNDALTVRWSPPTKAGSVGSRTYLAADLGLAQLKGPAPRIQDMSGFGPQWAGRRQVFFQPKRLGRQFGVKIPVEVAGRYAVRLRITRAQDYGRFSLAVEGSAEPSTPHALEGTGPGVSLSNPIAVGTYTFAAGENRLVFTVEDHGPASSGYAVGLDEIELTPAE